MMKINKVKLLRNNILVSEIEKGMQKVNGIIIPDDNMKDRGIKPRWCKVFAIGPKVYDIEVGMWILVDHGRWTRGFEAEISGETNMYRFVDFKDVLGVQWEKPEGINVL